MLLLQFLPPVLTVFCPLSLHLTSPVRSLLAAHPGTLLASPVLQAGDAQLAGGRVHPLVDTVDVVPGGNNYISRILLWFQVSDGCFLFTAETKNNIIVESDLKFCADWKQRALSGVET